MKRFFEHLINERSLVAFHMTLGGLSYHPIKKLRRRYTQWTGLLHASDLSAMPKMSWAVAPVRMRVVTNTLDGKETENTAEPADIIMSGVSGERYVVRAAKFAGLYTKSTADTVVPNQTPRMVARYTGAQTITINAPWGEAQPLRPGDYVVRDGDGYYRIARAEFELTYNKVPL